MKKNLVLIAVFVLLGVITSKAQDSVNVTFNVNMSVKVMEEFFDPGTEVVRSVGAVTNPAWSPSTSPDMLDPESDSIYTVTYRVGANSTYEYKYNIGMDWIGKDELQGQPNRQLTTGTTDMVLAVVWFDNDSIATIPGDTVNVTFQIDMGIEIVMGNFDPAMDVVTVPGGFNGWLNEPPANNTKTLDDSDGDSVYTKTIRMPGNATYEYKYNIGLGWDGKDETQGNRSLKVVASDTTLSPSFFDNYTAYTGVATNVTFNVDMRLPAQGAFDPTTDNVYVAGNFTDWQNAAVEMLDPDGDTTYTVALNTLTSGDLLIYKFVHSPTDAPSGDWESPSEGDDIFPPDNNRIFGPVDGDNVITRLWNNQDPNIQLSDGNILFEIDMSVMDEVGIFDNTVDSLQVRGSFNGWSGSDPARSFMIQDPVPPQLLYFLDVSFTQVVLGENQDYKFFLNLDDTSTMWIDGWERPNSTGGGNRAIEFLGEINQFTGTTYYDNISPEWVIESGVNLEMVFSVDMRPAMDPAIQPVPFNPAEDSLFWIAEQPSFVRSQGWVDEDEMRVLLLTDADGDSIYSGTLAPTPPTFNSFIYRYGFVDVSESGWTFEPSGFSNFAYRVRYIGQDAPRSFPFNPWNAPTDTWTNSEIKTDQEIDPYKTLVGVDDESDLYLNDYALEQNYPNPFNPSTIIRFSIPQAQFVTLNVFNILGEKVATLVNREMTTGVYHINFNAKNLSSGVYIYSIRAGEFNLTKKMVLLK